ncbi:MAG: hypothetical protein WA816_15440, partial [Bacteroidales bacterium]
FFLIPLGGTILSLSTMSLAIFYYIFGFAFFNQVEVKNLFKKEAYKESSVLKIAGAIVTGIGLSTTSLGILFKVQKWPLANENIMAGLFFIIIVSAIAIFKFLKNKNVYYKRILIRTLIAFVFGILFLRLSGHDITKIEFRNYPDYIKAYELSTANPNNDSLQKNLDLELKKTYMDQETFAAYLKEIENQKQK